MAKQVTGFSGQQQPPNKPKPPASQVNPPNPPRK